ncbi:hypothetical protein MYX77_14985, partial [Acidobacteriia bacterium AH_259_A11_L15]|nr:hypothetical protein [Acidobacteriia bacterium AH_259_A11_L15]
ADDKRRLQPGETSAFAQDEHEIQEHFWEETSAMNLAEEAEDRQSMKVAWIGALIFHFLLFITVFPEMGG